ncbi:MAG: KH domain-containing protein [Candidatus Krumholzibacteria bacterium]|nr:KH domain-containing protein [Candidatus Krumholzibacteria bacterium]
MDGREMTPAQARALDLLAYLTVNLVDHPDAVRIDLVSDQDREVFRLRLHPDDQGPFIGKNGQTARAVRSLLMAINARYGQRFALDIVED